MSTPQDILSQILQGGLLNYGKPNALDSGLMNGDPSMGLGMQLLANSNTPGTFGGILGRSMLGMQDRQQGNAGSQLDLMQKAQELRIQQAQQQALQDYASGLGQGPGAPQMPGQQPPAMGQQAPQTA